MSMDVVKLDRIGSKFRPMLCRFYNRWFVSSHTLQHFYNIRTCSQQ